MPVALAENALTTLSAAKDYLDISDSYTDEDDRIIRIINRASGLIASHTSRVLVTQEHTELYDGRRSNRLILNEFPILGGTAAGGKPLLYLSGNRDFTEPVDPTKYYFNDNEIIYPDVFPKGTLNIKVIYQAGLGKVDSVAETNTLPDDLELACLITVLWLYDTQIDRRTGKNSKTKGDESVSYALGLPQEVVEILDKSYTRDELPALAPVGIKNR